MTTTTLIDPATALGQARALIEDRITNQPRSLQTAIGPSELGTPCTHCLTARLAGWRKTDEGVAWLPYIGTAMHAQLEYEFTIAEGERAVRDGGPKRWHVEERVMVGHIGGQEVWGNTDLYDAHAAMTVDWKLVGATTLRTARGGPSPEYRTQSHLYGKGWEDAGHPVRYVAVYFLPRNAVSLDQAVVWHEPYDRAVAEQALERANHLHRQLDALRVLGDDVVNGWITGLDRAPGCRDCARFPDRPTAPVPTSIDDALGG